MMVSSVTALARGYRSEGRRRRGIFPKKRTSVKAVVRMATSSRERWVDFARTVICVVMKTARFKSHIELMMMFICSEFWAMIFSYIVTYISLR